MIDDWELAEVECPFCGTVDGKVHFRFEEDGEPLAEKQECLNCGYTWEEE